MLIGVLFDRYSPSRPRTMSSCPCSARVYLVGGARLRREVDPSDKISDTMTPFRIPPCGRTNDSATRKALQPLLISIPLEPGLHATRVIK